MSDLLFEYKVRARHRLGWKEFTFYATTDIEEFLNRNSIDYVRNATDTVENRLFKENKRLNNIINEANKILSNILVVSDWEHKGKYRPVKNTTSQEVYKSVCMLYGILKTPYRSDYGSLQELKGSNKQ